MNADSAKLAQEAAFAPNVVEGTFEFQGEMYNFKATPRQGTKMSDQHRATDSEWHCLKARTCGDKADAVAYSTIYELLCRIEALEMTLRVAAGTLTPAERAKMGVVPVSSLSDAVDRAASEAFRATSAKVWPSEVATTETQPNHPEIPDSSLKDRIKSLMQNLSGRCTWDEFTASILTEVATWLREENPLLGGNSSGFASLLELEAKR